jgi:hypothetical protein
MGAQDGPIKRLRVVPQKNSEQNSREFLIFSRMLHTFRCFCQENTQLVDFFLKSKQKSEKCPQR